MNARALLRVVEASFERDGVLLVAPFSLAIERGARAEISQPDARSASIAARMCAAVVKPTAGAVYIGEYETRLQPPQAKRLSGFVDAAGFTGDAHAFACEVAFRADVWGIPPAAAAARARAVLDALAAERENPTPYASAIALALVPDVALIVLDRPPPSLAARVRELVPAAALLVTLPAAQAAP